MGLHLLTWVNCYALTLISFTSSLALSSSHLFSISLSPSPFSDDNTKSCMSVDVLKSESTSATVNRYTTVLALVHSQSALHNDLPVYSVYCYNYF